MIGGGHDQGNQHGKQTDRPTTRHKVALDTLGSTWIHSDFGLALLDWLINGLRKNKWQRRRRRSRRRRLRMRRPDKLLAKTRQIAFHLSGCKGMRSYKLPALKLPSFQLPAPRREDMHLAQAEMATHASWSPSSNWLLIRLPKRLWIRRLWRGSF